MGLIPGLGRSPGGQRGNPLQCSCLEEPRDRGAWQATVHGIERSRTQLSDLARTHQARHQSPYLTCCKSHPWPVAEPGFKPAQPGAQPWALAHAPPPQQPMASPGAGYPHSELGVPSVSCSLLGCHGAHSRCPHDRRTHHTLPSLHALRQV